MNQSCQKINSYTVAISKFKKLGVFKFHKNMEIHNNRNGDNRM